MGAGTARTLVTRGAASRLPARRLLAVDGYAARQDSSRATLGRWQAALEGLVGRANFWRGKGVFVPGHTGFKGCWLSVWLAEMGASVTGFALPPGEHPNLFDLADVAGQQSAAMPDINDQPARDGAVRAGEP